MEIRLDTNTSLLGLHGGHGGFGFAEHGHLDESEVLVGLNVWSGDYIDSVQALYSRLLPNGLSGGVREGQRYGGRGGQLTTLYRPDHIITGLLVQHSWVIDRLAVLWRRCSSRGLEPSSIFSPSIGGSGGQPESLIETDGEVAVGIFGASGWYIDRISLITAGLRKTP